MRSKIALHATVTAMTAVIASNTVIGVETFLLVQLAFNGGQLTFDETLGAPNFPVVVGAIIVGILTNLLLGMLAVRPQLRWFISCQPADHARRRAVQRIPIVQLGVTVVSWSTTATVAGVAVAFALAGMSSACLTYLFAERAARPLAVVVLEDFPTNHVMNGVRVRMLAVWAVSSAVPMVGLLTVNAGRWTGLLPDVHGAVDWTTVILCLVGLASGARVIALVGQAITDPLTEMRRAVHRVDHGDYKARVPVYDSSELGVLQHGFNRMVEGLAERDRMREIFARHVGDTVAELAISDGVGMHGTNTRVGVLFVDIVGSTGLAQQRSPDDTAALLNAFFSIVADVVDQHSGFVNKFEGDAALAHDLSHLRMIKDDWELDQMQQAVDATRVGFEAVIRELPGLPERGRGERWVEGTFGLHARHQGNGVGYDSICASGDHANTLHWIKNDGEVKDGDLILLDAGVEVDSLFTADITRTLPVSGTFSPTQREVHEAVAAAQAAGIAAVKPGNKFSDVHAAAIRVVAEHLHAWGLLPEGVSVEDTLDTEHGQYHRRWMVHGTSHHLGIDVHDCALATREEYMDAELQPGMVLTVEPGIYFKADDLKVPERFRGIGVRLEDDVVVTEDGCRNLSGDWPHTADEVEAWIADVQGR